MEQWASESDEGKIREIERHEASRQENESLTDTCKNVNKISVPKETTGYVVNLVPICIRNAHWQPFTLNLLKDRPPANPK